MTSLRLPEVVVPGKRLGRHRNHDPLSRLHPVQITGPVALRSVVHRHYGPVLQQGDLGSCTGNALAQALNTLPLHKALMPLLTETDAVRLYSAATALDPFDGTYPPTDSGSDGNSVCKAARNEGRLRGWQHAFTVDQALAALVSQPIIVGTVWTEGCDQPDAQGYLNPKVGRARGGHEYALVALNTKREDVTMLQSWGVGWGASGRARIRWTDLAWLLEQDGDATVPLV